MAGVQPSRELGGAPIHASSSAPYCMSSHSSTSLLLLRPAKHVLLCIRPLFQWLNKAALKVLVWPSNNCSDNIAGLKKISPEMLLPEASAEYSMYRVRVESTLMLRIRPDISDLVQQVQFPHANSFSLVFFIGVWNKSALKTTCLHQRCVYISQRPSRWLSSNSAPFTPLKVYIRYSLTGSSSPL